MKTEHDRIYLAPSCLSFDGSMSCNPDRTWCEDPTNECQDCGNKPTTYLLATPVRAGAEDLFLALGEFVSWIRLPPTNNISIVEIRVRAEAALAKAQGDS